MVGGALVAEALRLIWLSAASPDTSARGKLVGIGGHAIVAALILGGVFRFLGYLPHGRWRWIVGVLPTATIVIGLLDPRATPLAGPEPCA